VSVTGVVYEPPVTATAELDEELTVPDDAWRPFEDVLDEDELEVEVAVLAVAPEDEEAETPGIVNAPTVPNTPTPATAAKAMPAVIRFSRDSARSRAWTLAFADLLSMAVRVLSATQSSL